MLNIFKRKLRISLLDEKWQVLKPIVRVDVVPRIGECLWLSDESAYYKVVNVVHNILDKHGIFVVLEKISIEDEKKSQIT